VRVTPPRATLGIAAALALAAAPAAAGRIDPAALLALPPADVVILGEVHDNPAHHANQAAAVAAIRPAALVFEMLTAEQAARITPANRADPAELARALDWPASGWPDFALYAPIFAAAPDAAVFGAALPAGAARAAMARGAAALFGPDAAAWGLASPLPPAEQAAREAAQAEAHCHAMPAALMPGMVAAQRLRDAAFARTAAAAHAATGGPVVVITGTGHARTDEGVPAALALGAPGLSVLAIGQVESDPGPAAPYDLWIVTAPHPRPDPCATLR
jgi:uncharacterized iron-regulated protein